MLASAVIIGSFIFVVFLALLCLLYITYLVDSATGVDLPTSRSAALVVAEIIQAYAPTATHVLDIGSGKGYFVRTLATTSPHLKVLGIEYGFWRWFFSHLFSRQLSKQVRFIKTDMWKFSYKEANPDVVYIYQPWIHMPGLEQVLYEQIKPEAIVISNTTRFPAWEPFAEVSVHPENPEFETLYIYKK